MLNPKSTILFDMDPLWRTVVSILILERLTSMMSRSHLTLELHSHYNSSRMSTYHLLDPTHQTSSSWLVILREFYHQLLDLPMSKLTINFYQATLLRWEELTWLQLQEPLNRHSQLVLVRFSCLFILPSMLRCSMIKLKNTTSRFGLSIQGKII